MKNSKKPLLGVPKPPQQPAKAKKSKKKNLSPAKKFRLRLRRAKFQKQQQAKEDYFEHDNREAAAAATSTLAVNNKKIVGQLNKKGRRAQMYIDAYLKSQQQHARRNGDDASQDETQESSNDVSMKSIVGFSSSPMMTKEQAIQNSRRMLFSVTNPSSTVSNASTVVKCCCHCACSGVKRKARRKLSSPYFGDFNRAMSFASVGGGGSCARGAAAVTTKILNKTTTTTHHETLVKAGAGDFVNYDKLSTLNSTAAKMNHHPVVAFKRNLNLQGRDGGNNGGCDMREVRSVVRFVMF